MPPRPLWLAEDPGETEVGCGINQGQVPALVVAPSRAPGLLLARLQAWPMISESWAQHWRDAAPTLASTFFGCAVLRLRAPGYVWVLSPASTEG